METKPDPTQEQDTQPRSRPQEDEMETVIELLNGRQAVTARNGQETICPLESR